MENKPAEIVAVSTHSRLKAAGLKDVIVGMQKDGFNTQPPEGGWFSYRWQLPRPCCFNTQPPEGGWHRQRYGLHDY